MKHILALVCCFFTIAFGTYAQDFSGYVPPVKPNGVKRPQYQITVSQSGKVLGIMTIELFPDIAPKHCRNFDSLVAIQFYDGTAFHRVIPEFMAQGGCPNSRDSNEAMWGFGSKDQALIPAEFNDIEHTLGILSAARKSDPNTATSQFFICDGRTSSLDGNYTVFGQILEGIDILAKIMAAPRKIHPAQLARLKKQTGNENPDVSDSDKSMPIQKISMTIRAKK